MPDDAATYKAKCAMCHTATASKFFDPAKPEAEQVQVILKGKKGEKPPYMPGFAEKGMTEDEAKALAAYMKTLKPAN
jgi:mono/diheme cytochrome c family protein